jgi:hypothetical protein
MKDILIQGKKLRRNYCLACMFCFSIAFNIYAIFKYESAWYEILTQLHIVNIIINTILPNNIAGKDFYKFLRKSIGK